MTAISSFAIVTLLLGFSAATPGRVEPGAGMSPETILRQNLAPHIQFDSTDLAWLAAPEGVRNRRLDHEPEGKLTGRVLHAVRDFNGDGVVDLGIFELKGGKLRKMHSSYEVHFGCLNAERQIVFSPEVGARVDSDGIPFDIVLHDFDDDGQLDVSIMVLTPGFFKVVKIVLSSMFRDSISLKLNLYRMDDGAYPSRPDAVRKVRTIPPLGESGELAANFPEIRFQDIDDDGHTDLLVQTGPERHLVYAGQPGPRLFASNSVEISAHRTAE